MNNNDIFLYLNVINQYLLKKLIIKLNKIFLWDLSTMTIYNLIKNI